MPESFVIGVDLGGTNVRACAYSYAGDELAPPVSIPSRAQEGTQKIVDAIVDVVEIASSNAHGTPDGIGIAVPGHLDSERGIVRWSPNFGEEKNGVFISWRDVPLMEMLKEKLNAPIFTCNDANLAALGEYRFGTGRNSAACLVMLTIGTGIGGGVIMSSHSVLGEASGPLMLLGGNHGGAELGHILLNYGGLDCNAGSYGPIEAYCQRDSIIKRAQHRLLRGRDSLLTKMTDGDYSKITPKMLTEAADLGDELASEVWDEVGMYLGAGIGALINVFAPDVFAIGGQIAKAGGLLLKPAIRSAQNVAIPSLFSDVNIQIAEQIEDAGMLGGAALALMKVQR